MTRLLTVSVLLLLFGVGVRAQTGFPTVLVHVAPIYPAAARAVRATGFVQLGVEVNSAGNIDSVRAFFGHPLLLRAAEAALEKWKFSSEPGIHFLHITIGFRAGDAETEQTIIRGPYNLTIVMRRPDAIAP
jgi:TonB family protein